MLSWKQSKKLLKRSTYFFSAIQDDTGTQKILNLELEALAYLFGSSAETVKILPFSNNGAIECLEIA